jgi:hypothetical protein
MPVDDTHLLVKPDQVENIKDMLQEEVRPSVAWAMRGLTRQLEKNTYSQNPDM